MNKMEERKLSRTAQVVSKTIYEAMRLLAASGGPMTVTQLREQIAQNLIFTEWERQSPSTKTQQPRWAINRRIMYLTTSKLVSLQKTVDCGT